MKGQNMAKKPSSLSSIKAALSGKAPGAKGGGGDIKWYSPPKGTEKVRLRVLPMKDKDFPIKMLMRHYNIPDLEKNPICLTMYEKECPVCEVLKEYDGQIDLSDWASSVQCYANVLVRNDPTQKVHAKEVHVLRGSRGVLQWFVDIWDEEGGPTICDPYDGRDINIHRKKFNGAFEVNPAFSSSAIADDTEEVDQILSKVVDLDKIWGAPNDNDMAEIKKGAEALREVIENKILAASNGDESEPAADPDVADTSMPDSDDQAVEGATEGEEETATEETATEEEVPAEEEQQEEEAPAPPPKAAPATKKPAPQPATKPAAAKPAARPAAGAGTSTASKTAPATKVATPAPKPGSSLPKPGAKPGGAAPSKAPPAKTAPKPSRVRVEKPKGAPDCFADAGVYDENSDKCLECPHDFNCREAIQNARA
jgi:hypothetical protein